MNTDRFWYSFKEKKWYSLDELITIQRNKKQIRLINNIPIWSKVKINCQCGLTIKQGYLRRHLQTNKHKKIMKKKKLKIVESFTEKNEKK